MTTKHSTDTPLSSTQKKTPYYSLRVRKLVLTLLSLIILACIASFLYTYQQQFINQVHMLTTEVVALKQRQTENRALLDSNWDKVSLIQAKLDDRLDVISKNLSQALHERWYQNNDWLLFKALYYLELAEINLHWSNNTQIAVALFQQADDLLAHLHEPELYGVRQAIVEEMTQLRAMPAVDIVGLLAKLDAAQQLLIRLPIKTPLSLTKTSLSPAETNSVEPRIPPAWREQLQNSMQLLEKLVVIRHHAERIEPLFSPEYESILRQTCILNLQEVQWAVIQRNPEVYKLLLTQVINTIKRTFDLKAQNTQTLLQQLYSLQEISLDSQKPTTGKSLLLLNKAIKSKTRRSVVTPESDPTSKTEKKNQQNKARNKR